MPYFLIYLFLEVLVSVGIASAIGPIYTFLEIIVTAIIGTMILKHYDFAISKSIKALNKNEITMEEFQRINALSITGAILLILPGFLTDIIGILLQFNFIGVLVAKMLLKLSLIHI